MQCLQINHLILFDSCARDAADFQRVVINFHEEILLKNIVAGE